MLTATVSQAVQAVCPAYGVSLGDHGDKSTWKVDFKPAATAQQKADAQTAINNFNLAAFNNADAAKKQAKKDRYGDADYADLVDKLEGKTPAQIKNYVTNNVTDLASAKLLLMKILLILSLK